MYKMCTVTRPNLLADCQLSVVRPRKIGTNHPLQWVVVDKLQVSGLRNWVSKDFKDGVETSASIQRPIDLIVKSVTEKPFSEPLQVPLEPLLKQELLNLVLISKSFHQKT